MALLVNSLIKCACKLLHRMDQNLLSLTIHLKALGQCLALALNNALTSEDHVALNLMGIDINLARSLIKRMEHALVTLVSLLSNLVLHDALQGLDFVTSHPLKLLSLHLILGGRELPLTLNLVHLGHDFPAECLAEL